MAAPSRKPRPRAATKFEKYFSAKLLSRRSSAMRRAAAGLRSGSFEKTARQEKNLRRVVDPYEQKYERGRRSGLRQREAIYGPLNKQGDTSGQGQMQIGL